MKPSRRNRFLLLLIASGALVMPKARAAGVEVAGNLLVDLRADVPSAGTEIWVNGGSEGDFTLLVDSDPVNTVVGGVPYVSLDVDDQYIGPEAPSQVTGAGTRSVEVWVRNADVGNEEIMVAWGKRGTSGGNYAFSYGSNAGWGALGGWGYGDVPWYPGVVGAPTAGQLHHLVITYDGTTTRLYVDGVETNSSDHLAGDPPESVPLATFNDPNLFLINAAWESDNVSMQRPNTGEMDYSVIRVHDGVLTPEQILSNHELGWSGNVLEGPRWTGAVDGDWATADNWDPAAVPEAGEVVVFGGEGSTGSVTLDQSRTQAGLGFESAVPTTIGSGGEVLSLGDGTADALVEASGSHSITAPVELASAVRFGVSGSASRVELLGALAGSGDLFKEGTGTLVISGVNTHDGATTVSGGVLEVIGGESASPVMVAEGGTLAGSGNASLDVVIGSGGRLAPGGVGTVGTMTFGDLGLGAGSVLELDFGTGNDLITVEGAFDLSGGDALVLIEGSEESFGDEGSYTIASFGSLTGDVGNLAIANPAPGKNYGFEVVGNELRLTISLGSVWNGGGDPDVNWSTPANWGGVTVSDGTSLEFGVSPTAPSSNNDLSGGSYRTLRFQSGGSAYELSGNAIELTGDSSGDLIVNESAESQSIALPIDLSATGSIVAEGAPVTVSGAISGSGGLRKEGASPLVLGGANTFSGGIVVAEGELGLASAGALGTGSLTVINATVANATAGPLVLSPAGGQIWGKSVDFIGPAIDTGGAAVTLNSDTRLGVVESLSLGTVDGAWRLSQESGRLTLTGGPGVIGSYRLGWDTVEGDSEGEGEFILDAGSDLTVNGLFGQRSATRAHLAVNDATLTIAGDWRLGHDVQRGSARIDSGTVNHTGGIFDIGFNGGQASVSFAGDSVYNGDGRLVQISTAWNAIGSLSLEDQATFTSGDLWVGGQNNVTATVNLAQMMVDDDATLTVNGSLFIAREGIGEMSAQFNQQGGSTTVGTAVKLGGDTGVNAASSIVGNLNLAGGTLVTPAIEDYLGTGTLSFLGGSLVITPAELNGISADHLYLYEDAVIDTGGADVDVNGYLENPEEMGIGSIAITEGGSGYQELPPMVRITGGTGVGASAVAVVDPDTGAVTGIQVTSPGANYYEDDELVVELIGGSGVGAVVGEIGLIDNSTFSGGLTKTGSGTLSLRFPAFYRGDTNVLGGTLSVLDEFLDDDSTLRLGSGAIIHLDTLAATDTVRRLFLDGIQQAAGTWGAIGSGADHETARITGDGMLDVLEAGTGETPFQTWIADAAFGLAPEDRDPEDDTDGDGFPHILEFGLNGNPVDASDRGLYAVAIQDVDGGGEELTLVAALRRGAVFTTGAGGSLVASVDGITYTVSGSLDLAAFEQAVSDAGRSNTVDSLLGLPPLDGEAWEYGTFILDGSEGLDGKGFLRIGVD